jgi:hypothetical protein
MRVPGITEFNRRWWVPGDDGGPGYVGIGLALGLTISPATTDALSTAAPDERGEASGLTQMTRQLGGSIGLATLAEIIAGIHAGPGAAAARSATTTGTADGYLVAAGVMVSVAIATAALHRRHPVPDDGLDAFGAKASPRLAVLGQAPQLTAV